MSSGNPAPATELDDLLIAEVRKPDFDPARAEELLRLGANINAYCKSGSSVLIHASTNSAKVVRFLLDNGADINFGRPHDNQTALMFAAWNGNYPVVKLLLESSAKVNIQNDMGYTALSWLARGRSYKDIMRLLIDHGADPAIRLKDGRKGVDLAKEQGHMDVITMLDIAEFNLHASPEARARRETVEKEVRLVLRRKQGKYLLKKQ